MPIEEMVNYEYHNIFPTSIYIGEMNGHVRHKEVFYNEIYPKYQFPRMNKDGDINTVSESEGKPIIHTEESAVPMMKEITEHIKIYYTEILGLKDVFDVYHTKSWISRSYDNEELVPEHLHSPSHISYAYYVNAPEGSHALSFYDKKKMGNAIFQSVFDYYHEDDTFMNQYTFESTQKYSIESKEGTICIFPSKTPHGTDPVSEVFSGERLAISGDCIITLKESERMKYSVGYINPKYWRKY